MQQAPSETRYCLARALDSPVVNSQSPLSFPESATPDREPYLGGGRGFCVKSKQSVMPSDWATR